MRIPIITANWKMNKTISETEEFITSFLPMVEDASDVDIIIAPPFTSLSDAAGMLRDSNIYLAAQDVFYEDKGAFTGEVSPLMLKDIGCSHVIIGHSERRQFFGETDETVNKKITAAKRHDLEVILCIGESLSERKSGETFNVLERQLSEGLKGIDISSITIAYEPVWAIGTGKTATPEQANDAHRFIRQCIRNIYGDNASMQTRILYGGSVTPENISGLMKMPEIDGALVGGASLRPEGFAGIVRYNRIRP